MIYWLGLTVTTLAIFGRRGLLFRKIIHAIVTYPVGTFAQAVSSRLVLNLPRWTLTTPIKRTGIFSEISTRWNLKASQNPKNWQTTAANSKREKGNMFAILECVTFIKMTSAVVVAPPDQPTLP